MIKKGGLDLDLPFLGILCHEDECFAAIGTVNLEVTLSHHDFKIREEEDV